MAESVLSLVVIRAREVERALAFYRALGLAFVREQHGTGPVHYACSLGATVIEIYPATTESEPGRRAPGATMLGFTVEAIEPVLVSVRGLGARVLTEPKTGSAGRWVVEDPDGRSVELTERTDEGAT
jgi:catechol 2,3-dioxygenase-like lactoylglutathione lyase family enzyme